MVAADRRKEFTSAFSPNGFREQTLEKQVWKWLPPFSTHRTNRLAEESSTCVFDAKKGSGKSFFEGVPSTPGFKPGQIDKLTSWAVSTTSNR